MKENKPKLEVGCGTCRWYDPLIDMCRNPKKPNSRIQPSQNSVCWLWEGEYEEE